MTYAAIMVYVEADATPEHRVRLAATLADKFNSRLIGLSALGVPPPIVANGMVLDEPTSIDIDLMRAKLANKGGWFNRIAGDDQRRIEWRSALDLPIEAVTREARSADLVVIGQMKATGGAYRALDPGEAVLKMGRPTLVVPDGVSTLRAEHVVIGWKDTREARRAVYDALPLLQGATRVTIVGACKGDEEKTALRHLDDLNSLFDVAPDQRRPQGHTRAKRIRRCAIDPRRPGGRRGSACDRRLWTQPPRRMGLRRHDRRPYRDQPDLLSHVSLTLYGR